MNAEVAATLRALVRERYAASALPPPLPERRHEDQAVIDARRRILLGEEPENDDG